VWGGFRRGGAKKKLGAYRKEVRVKWAGGAKGQDGIIE